MFSPGTPMSSTNETDRHDIVELLLKVVLNTINITLTTTLIQNSKTFVFPFVFINSLI
jgi:hypothetical protein